VAPTERGLGVVAKAKRGRKALPELTPIKGLRAKEAVDYLSAGQRSDLKRRLTATARARRRVEPTSKNLRLS
jgi:hypothetical protein